MTFKNKEHFERIRKILEETTEALKDKDRTLEESDRPDLLTGVIGVGIVSATAGTAAMIGKTVLVGKAATVAGGVALVAAPFALLAAGGSGILIYKKTKREREEKERLYQEAIKKHNAIIKAMKEELNATKERSDYLYQLNEQLKSIIADLSNDLGYVALT